MNYWANMGTVVVGPQSVYCAGYVIDDDRRWSISIPIIGDVPTEEVGNVVRIRRLVDDTFQVIRDLKSGGYMIVPGSKDDAPYSILACIMEHGKNARALPVKLSGSVVGQGAVNDERLTVIMTVAILEHGDCLVYMIDGKRVSYRNHVGHLIREVSEE